MSQLEKEMANLITKNMPEEVGKNLKKLLEEGEANKRRVSELESHNKDLIKSMDNLKSRAEKTKSLNERENALNHKQEELVLRELELDKKILEIRLEEANSKIGLINNYTQGLVRNTIIRESILDSENSDIEGYYDNNGNWIPSRVKNVSKSYKKDTSQE